MFQYDLLQDMLEYQAITPLVILRKKSLILLGAHLDEIKEETGPKTVFEEVFYITSYNCKYYSQRPLLYVSYVCLLCACLVRRGSDIQKVLDLVLIFVVFRALVSDKWIEFKLQEKAKVSHNTHLYRFSFDPNLRLGLDVASCLVTRAPLGEDAEGKKKYVVRPYTPISDPDSKGYFDLMIKIYPEGKMSQHFDKLKPGDVVEVKGPIEKLRYTPNMKKHIGMIAGGSGVTPMLQIIEAILKNPDDNTKVTLIYANVSPDDILLKKKLDMLAASHPNLKVFYTVDNPSKYWVGGTGYISKDMVSKGLPPPSDDTLVLVRTRLIMPHNQFLVCKCLETDSDYPWANSQLCIICLGVCGPPGMMEHVSGGKAKDWSQGEVSGVLKELGYTEEMVYKF
ncbi:NADH-cytochrome b5 reductase-like protein [Tanacetum coccineum]